MRSVAPSIESITGYPPAALLGEGGRPYASIVHPDDLEAMTALFREALDRREAYAIEYRLVHADGSTRWVQGHGQGVYGPDGTVEFVDGVLYDVTARRSGEERLAHLALHDPLTDLPNRALFQEHLTVAIANAARTGFGGAVLFIDLDDFKLVNDTLRARRRRRAARDRVQAAARVLPRRRRRRAPGR